MTKGINVLSLFDGMSCGSLALDEAGIEVNKYYASEIDPYAIKVAQNNYPDSIQLGGVENWWDWDIDLGNIDLLIGGSPCQGFSYAGKQLAFDDPRSKLFFNYVDILNCIKELNPDVLFMLENVKMKPEYLEIITNTLGVSKVLINSNLVSAQNRLRYYWANWLVKPPADKGVLLKHIIEGAVKSKAKTLRVGGRGSPEGSKQEWDGVYTHTNKSAGVCYRKLSVIECERLQTVPDNYTDGVSDTQRYKMLGNGWTVDVIAHILKQMPLEETIA